MPYFTHPELCQKCFKNKNIVTDKSCKLCLDLNFNEQIFCELNQYLQREGDFTCGAFKPLLRNASNQHENNSKPKNERKSKLEKISDYCNSNKAKYQKAFMLQKLQQHEDEIFIESKYHFAWSTAKRDPIFDPPKDFANCIHESFNKYDYDLLKGFPTLLWLAPNHIHIYSQSDGTISIEDIVIKLKDLTNASLSSSFEKLKGVKVWDDSYYTETLG